MVNAQEWLEKKHFSKQKEEIVYDYKVEEKVEGELKITDNRLGKRRIQ